MVRIKRNLLFVEGEFEEGSESEVLGLTVKRYIVQTVGYPISTIVITSAPVRPITEEGEWDGGDWRE